MYIPSYVSHVVRISPMCVLSLVSHSMYDSFCVCVSSPLCIPFCISYFFCIHSTRVFSLLRVFHCACFTVCVPRRMCSTTCVFHSVYVPLRLCPFLRMYPTPFIFHFMYILLYMYPTLCIPLRVSFTPSVFKSLAVSHYFVSHFVYISHFIFHSVCVPKSIFHSLCDPLLMFVSYSQCLPLPIFPTS